MAKTSKKIGVVSNEAHIETLECSQNSIKNNQITNLYASENITIIQQIAPEIDSKKRKELLDEILAYYRSDDRVKHIMAQYVFRVYGENGESKRFIDLSDEQLQDAFIFVNKLKQIHNPEQNKDALKQSTFSWFFSMFKRT